MILSNKWILASDENAAEINQKVIAISDKLGINPDWLMMVMWLESKLDSQAVNPVSHATGLIQFMPDTAKGMGTTTAALYDMYTVDQLDWVYQYFKPYKGFYKSFTDLYIVTFFPIALNKPDNFVFQTNTKSAQLIASQNKIFDINHDNKITKAEFVQYILAEVPQEYYADVIKKKTTQSAMPDSQAS